MKSGEIKKVLSAFYNQKKTKHKSFCEVKTGNTMSDGTPMFIIDFLAYKIGWKTSELIGFEIKVSRGDFKSDKKWKNYLDFVNKFYFACPEGLIKKEELPEDMGLVYVLEDLSLKWIRRAKKINDKPNTSIFQYLVNSRI